MQASEINKDIKRDSSRQNRGTINIDDPKMSNTMLNNFSVERILSENTQSVNHMKSDMPSISTFSNKFVDRKRRLLDENINTISVAKYKVSNGAKLPKICSSLLETWDENKIDSQGNNFFQIKNGKDVRDF